MLFSTDPLSAAFSEYLYLSRQQLIDKLQVPALVLEDELEEGGEAEDTPSVDAAAIGPVSLSICDYNDEHGCTQDDLEEGGEAEDTPSEDVAAVGPMSLSICDYNDELGCTQDTYEDEPEGELSAGHSPWTPPHIAQRRMPQGGLLHPAFSAPGEAEDRDGSSSQATSADGDDDDDVSGELRLSEEMALDERCRRAALAARRAAGRARREVEERRRREEPARAALRRWRLLSEGQEELASFLAEHGFGCGPGGPK